MKNFHWGKAITLFFIIYIGVLISVVIKSRTVDHALVTEDYYAEDLIYQQHYDMVSNQMVYFPDITLDYDSQSETVLIDWKDNTKNLKGQIQLYRAANMKKDQIIEVTLDKLSSRISLPVHDLVEGKWSGLLTWTDGEREYYFEESFYVVLP